MNRSFDNDSAFEAWETGASTDPGQPRGSLSERASAAAVASRGPARVPDYLDGLNPPQREAVETIEGPVLLLAGAGTGKTKALTTRLAHIVATRRAWPSQVLAVTFTNKAAREMRERTARLLGEAMEGMPWLGTFHAINVKILRRHAELVGLKQNFTILDTDDQIRLIKQLLSAEGIDDKRWPARMFASMLDRWKNRALGPGQVPPDEASFANNRGAELYRMYQERLQTLNAVDFGDLILHVITIFQNHGDIRADYRRRFKFVLVDEYQDTNVAQYLWLRHLAQAEKDDSGTVTGGNICCVGDDDQSIYGWRGAEVANILNFEKHFPGAKVIRLEQNYRSTSHILGAASGLIAANSDRLGKTLWTEAEGGEKVRLIGHWDGEEEARWIGDEIEALQRGTRGHDPVDLDDIAILVRASFQMRAFEDRFLQIGLPYRVIGGPRFYERMEIRDAMAYFRVAVSTEDGLAFERIMNTPKRGVGEKAGQALQRLAREHGVGLYEAARIAGRGGVDGISAKAAKALKLLTDQIEIWHGFTQGAVSTGEGVVRMDHVRLAEKILDESGYTAMWQADKSAEAPGRLENLKELVGSLEEFENLQGFLEHVSLVMDNESEGSGAKVSIMTLHAAKGLEFPAVFLPGWEDGLFPSQRAMDESGVKGLEEERRLAYVGTTRAEEHLTISFVANRQMYGRWQSALPSRFIDELPEIHVEVLTPPGLYGHERGAGPSPMTGTASGLHAGPLSSSALEAKAVDANAYNSPGWRRLAQRRGQHQISQPREVRNLVVDAEAVSRFEIGTRVFHQKFGYGAVTQIEGDKLGIAFEKAGTKKVLASFVTEAGRAGGDSSAPADGTDDVPF
ncbi:MAG: UvrD-helicase domain-containing protein [Pseudomonadota bacterium]